MLKIKAMGWLQAQKYHSDQQPIFKTSQTLNLTSGCSYQHFLCSLSRIIRAWKLGMEHNSLNMASLWSCNCVRRVSYFWVFLLLCPCLSESWNQHQIRWWHCQPALFSFLYQSHFTYILTFLRLLRTWKGNLDFWVITTSGLFKNQH